MKANIKLGSVWGIELGLHFSWLLIALLITFSLAQEFHATNPAWSPVVVWASAMITGLLFFAGLFAHELSHAFVAKLRGLPIHRITLFFLGGVAQIEKEASDPSTEFWMGIAGPIMSVVVGFACLAIAYALGWPPNSTPVTPPTAIFVWLGYINLILAAFNMIPGFPLDGGRVLRAIIWWFNKNEVKATRIAARVGQVVAAVFIAWGIYRFFTGAGLNGLWLAFIGWFLMQAASGSYLQVRAETALRDLRVADVMSRDYIQVDADTSVQTFVDDYVLRTGRRCFIVVKDGYLVGLITPAEVRGLDRESWRLTRVEQIMRPADRIHSVQPDTPVYNALEIMGREDVNQLPVIQNGNLQGIVSRGHVLQLLQSRSEMGARDASNSA